MKRETSWLIVALVLGLVSPATLAQSVHDGNQTGLPPFGTFHGSNFDVVSFQNGNLHIEIPIVSVSQRGGSSFTYRYIYDVPNWALRQAVIDSYGTIRWYVDITNLDTANWHLVSPLNWDLNYEMLEQQCTWLHPYTQETIYNDYVLYRNFTVTDPSGAKHPFFHRYETYTPNGGACQNGDLPYGNLLSGAATDGSGIYLDMPNGPFGSITIRLKDGSNAGALDTNGNYLYGGDTLNRIILSTASFPQGSYPPQYTIWTVNNSAGNPLQYRVDWVTVSYSTNFCPALPITPPPDCMEISGSWQAPSKLTLPNGKFYSFTWAQNAHSELLRVDLPTGSYISYDYSTQAYAVRKIPSDRTNITAYYDVRREVAVRTVNDGNSSQTWNYIRGVGSEQGSRIVQDPLGNEEVRVLTKIGDSSYEAEVRTYQGSRTSGTLLRTVYKDYTYELGPVSYDDSQTAKMNVRVIRETTILDDGKQSKVETDYETFQQSYFGAPYTSTRLNVLEKSEFGLGSGGPGGLARRTAFSYLHTNNQPYIDRNIVDRVTLTSVYDGSGVLQAQTQNDYDIYNYSDVGSMQPSNVVRHDSTNYGTSFVYRGNVTATKRWRNSDGTWLETRHQYDDAGNILKTKDPLGHLTTFDYTDNWSNSTCAPAGAGRAYPKSVTNALGHVTTYSYNSCTGTVASTTDPNNQTTTFAYDPYDRADITNFPDGGQVDRDYDDTFRIVTTKTKRTSSAYIFAKTTYDALGRVTREELCEDGTLNCAPSIKTDTTYDTLGQKATVSNPYRSTSESTYGITSFVYDALGRVTKVVPPDSNGTSNFVLTEYFGNRTTVTDQAGKQRRSYTDALGRLVEVHEPAGGGPATGSSGSATVNGSGVQAHNISAVAASGWLSLSGGVQSTQTQTQSATQSTGNITVNGSEQSTQVQTNPGAAGTGSVTVNGSEQVRWATQAVGLVNITGSEQAVWREVLVWGCVLYDESGGCMEEGWISEWQWVYDSGSVYVTVNGQYKSAWYGQGSTGDSIAQDLANAINADGSYPVTASAGGTVLYLTSKTYGAGANYSLAAGSWSYENFDPPSFVPSPSGSNLTGGVDTLFDVGSVWVTVNGVAKSVSYGQGSTSSLVASALVSAINGDGAYPVSASQNGATVNLTAKTVGANTNYSLSSGSSTSQGGVFSSPSFSTSASGSTLTGGSNPQYQTVYDSGTVSVTVNGFAATVNFGQGSSTGTIASDLRNVFNSNPSSPVTAGGTGAGLP